MSLAARAGQLALGLAAVDTIATRPLKGALSHLLLVRPLSPPPSAIAGKAAAPSSPPLVIPPAAVGPSCSQSGNPIPGPPCAEILQSLILTLEISQTYRPRMDSPLASMPPHPRVPRSCCDLVVGGSPISVHPNIRSISVARMQSVVARKVWK